MRFVLISPNLAAEEIDLMALLDWLSECSLESMLAFLDHMKQT